MSADDRKKYVKPQVKRLRVERGRYARKAAMSLTTLELELEREMHTAFCAMTTEEGSVPSRGVQDIRQHSQHPWRVLARRLREAHAAGVHKQQLHNVVRVFEHYVDRLGQPRTRKHA